MGSSCLAAPIGSLTERPRKCQPKDKNFLQFRAQLSHTHSDPSSPVSYWGHNSSPVTQSLCPSVICLEKGDTHASIIELAHGLSDERNQARGKTPTKVRLFESAGRVVETAALLGHAESTRMVLSWQRK